ILGPEVGAVQLELHAGDAHVVARVGSDRDRGRDGGSAGRRRDGDRRRRRVGRGCGGEGGGGRRVARRGGGDGGERVAPVGRGRCIAGDGVRQSRILGREVGAVQLELHAGDAHVVARVGSDRDGGGDGGSAGGRRDGDRGRRGVRRGYAREELQDLHRTEGAVVALQLVDGRRDGGAVVANADVLRGGRRTRGSRPGASGFRRSIDVQAPPGSVHDQGGLMPASVV